MFSGAWTRVSQSLTARAGARSCPRTCPDAEVHDPSCPAPNSRTSGPAPGGGAARGLVAAGHEPPPQLLLPRREAALLGGPLDTAALRKVPAGARVQAQGGREAPPSGGPGQQEEVKAWRGVSRFTYSSGCGRSLLAPQRTSRQQGRPSSLSTGRLAQLLHSHPRECPQGPTEHPFTAGTPGCPAARTRVQSPSDLGLERACSPKSTPVGGEGSRSPAPTTAVRPPATQGGEADVSAPLPGSHLQALP